MSVLALILAGGTGSRLTNLGEKRAQPAVPFAGKYRNPVRVACGESSLL